VSLSSFEFLRTSSQSRRESVPRYQNNIKDLDQILSPFLIFKKSNSNPISNLGDKNQGNKRYFIANKNPVFSYRNWALRFLGTLFSIFYRQPFTIHSSPLAEYIGSVHPVKFSRSETAQPIYPGRPGPYDLRYALCALLHALRHVYPACPVKFTVVKGNAHFTGVAPANGTGAPCTMHEALLSIFNHCPTIFCFSINNFTLLNSEGQRSVFIWGINFTPFNSRSEE